VLLLDQLMETADVRQWPLLPIAHHCHLVAGVSGVTDQEYPLIIWVNDIPELGLSRGRLI